MKGLNETTVIVTGGGGGIGRAICRRFGEEGSRVAVLDRDPEAAAATVELILEAGGSARAYAADITDYNAIAETLAAIETDLGVPRVLVNNAGFDRFMPFLKTEPGLWQQLIAVNLTGGCGTFAGMPYICGFGPQSIIEVSPSCSIPSMAISASAGTLRSMVSHGTISTSWSMIVPNMSISPQESMCTPA